MAKYLQTLRDEVKRLVKDKDEYLESADFEDAIDKSTRLLSRKNPYVVIRDESGNGTDYQWDVQSNFYYGFSSVISVFYPFESTTQTPVEPLDAFDWEIVEKSQGTYVIRIKSGIPATGETLRYYYTTYHTITETASTVSLSEDEDSIVYYAASLCLKRMAANAIAVRNPTINADTVDYQSRSREYRDLAKLYEEMSGLSAYANQTQLGAIVYQDYDPPTPYGENQLTHFREWR